MTRRALAAWALLLLAACSPPPPAGWSGYAEGETLLNPPSGVGEQAAQIQAGDLNNDGFLDVQNGNKVYFNTPNANNWIKINLQGVISNRNGIGARVEIYGAWGKQIREIRSGHGFSHQSTLNAHFGIGTETQVTQVRVLWPSGQVDIINNPTINRLLITKTS